MMAVLDLSFRGIRASNGRHAIHDYPAMLHYKLVEYLIKEFGGDRQVLYDPFCGSGVSLVEGLKAGYMAYGTDINPLALLIADARSYTPTKEINFKELEAEIRKAVPDVPEVKNIDYWFKQMAIEELGKIRRKLFELRSEEYYELALCAFSQTVRLSSNTRKGEFKRYRMTEEELKRFEPKPIETFIKLLMEYYEITKNEPIDSKPILFLHDVREPLPFEGYDLVITSPPYGDSKTTVAYGEFSSFSLEWLYGLNPYGNGSKSIDKLSLGGSKKSIVNVSSITFEKVYSELKTFDESRAESVKSFFYDLEKSCKNIVKGLNPGGVICFVVANRRVKGVEVPTSQIVREIFESLGLRHIKTFVRDIHNKRMPLLNSPTNIKGEVSQTMRQEYILVMERL